MKMCPFCGNQVKDNAINCPYCKLSLNDRYKVTVNVNKFLKTTVICIIFLIIIFTPALIIMSYAFPVGSGLKEQNNKKICRKECGIFSYEFTSDENYCICDNGNTYNTKSGRYMFNINSALTDKVVSYRENNLDKFEDDLVNKQKMMVIVQSEDSYEYIEQINSLVYLFENNNFEDVSFHYIELDKLGNKDITRLNEFCNKELNGESYIILINNGKPIYVVTSFNAFNSYKMKGLLEQYFY